MLGQTSFALKCAGDYSTFPEGDTRSFTQQASGSAASFPAFAVNPSSADKSNFEIVEILIFKANVLTNDEFSTPSGVMEWAWNKYFGNSLLAACSTISSDNCGTYIDPLSFRDGGFGGTCQCDDQCSDNTDCCHDFDTCAPDPTTPAQILDRGCFASPSIAAVTTTMDSLSASKLCFSPFSLLLKEPF